MCRKGRIRAWFRRRELVKLLGGKCVDCGTTKDHKKNPLEIDHPNGRDYDLRKMDQTWRVAVYFREYRNGVKLEVRCRRCNANAHKVNGQSVAASLAL